jgi:dynein heavy chain 1
LVLILQSNIAVIKIVNAHAKLQERLSFIRAFRKQHEQLYNTIVKVSKNDSSTGSTAVQDVLMAFESVKTINVLDLTAEGNEIWVAAEISYNDRVSRVENQIIATLRDRLGAAKNANEMFRVFSKFNSLFIRPKIRGAIQEYQNQLIESVKDDIKTLHDKFKLTYRSTASSKMGKVRDLPPVSGAIIWARQIERQLGTYMKRVEDVLGRGWEMYAEGQKLAQESMLFRKKLDTKPVFAAWLEDITKRDLSVTGRVFEIKKVHGSGYQLSVNFDSQIISLFKEVRNMIWLNFQVPHSIANSAKDAKRVYPFAVGLIETCRTYTQVSGVLGKNPDILPLVAGYQGAVHELIKKGIQERWDYFVNTFESRAIIEPVCCYL